MKNAAMEFKRRLKAVKPDKRYKIGDSILVVSVYAMTSYMWVMLGGSIVLPVGIFVVVMLLNERERRQ